LPSARHTDDPGRIAAALVVAVIDGDRNAAELLLRDCDVQTCAQVAVSLAVMLIAVADAPPARIRARVTEILRQHPPRLGAAGSCRRGSRPKCPITSGMARALPSTKDL
jgi:hypothetical protein